MPAPKGNKYSYGGGRPRKIDVADLSSFGLKMRSWFVGIFNDLANKVSLLESEDEKRVSKKNIVVFPPTFRRFAFEYDISEDTLKNYCAESKVFFGIYNQCKGIQKDYYLLALSNGLMPPHSGVFLAKNETDMRDRTETDITSGGKPLGLRELSNDELERIASGGGARTGQEGTSTPNV